MNTQQWEPPALVGLVVIGVIGVVSVMQGGDGGLQVASAAVGGIAGWLARSGNKVANVEHANNVQGAAS